MFTPNHVSHVMYQVLRVTCPLSHISCNVSLKEIFFFYCQNDEAYRWRVCYQQDLLCLVFVAPSLWFQPTICFLIYFFCTNYAGTVYSTVYTSFLMVKIVTVNSSNSEFSTDELTVFFFFFIVMLLTVPRKMPH